MRINRKNIPAVLRVVLQDVAQRSVADRGPDGESRQPGDADTGNRRLTNGFARAHREVPSHGYDLARAIGHHEFPMVQGLRLIVPQAIMRL